MKGTVSMKSKILIIFVTVQTLTCIKKTDGINLKQSSINHRFSLSKDLGHFVK